MTGLAVRILDRADVRTCLRSIDLVGVVESVLRSHAEGATELPAEGSLRWTNAEGDACRSLAMLGALNSDGSGTPVLGIKVINASVGNSSRGLERASGIGMVFDPLTAGPRVLAEVGLISAVRTAAYTVLSVRHLGPKFWSRLGLLGAGLQARTHLDMLLAAHPEPVEVRVHDVDTGRAESFAAWARAHHPKANVSVHGTPRQVTLGSEVLVAVTTSEQPYLEPDDLRPGSFVAHVSLDDLGEQAFTTADAIFVDDVTLVGENPSRILGALMASGRVLPPGKTPTSQPGRPLDGTLGDVLIGRCPAIRPVEGTVVSNPFGMSVLDVGLLDAVHQRAERNNLGHILELMPDDPEEQR